MTKKALITGVTGQDGSYLAELLLEKGYEVHGIKRRASSLNTQRIDHIFEDPHNENPNFLLHYGDLTDASNLTRIISEIEPDEVYNLGAQSHVAVSFETPEYTADVDALGALRLLEAIRFLGLENKTKFYQASSSELYGLVQETPQKETTPFIQDPLTLFLNYLRIGLLSITENHMVFMHAMGFYLIMNPLEEGRPLLQERLPEVFATLLKVLRIVCM